MMRGARVRRRVSGAVAALALIAGVVGGMPVAAADGVRVVQVARGLDTPWALAFLPDGRLLVTERPGRMRVVSADGTLSAPIAGLPEVQARGQGGLLDVVLSPSFERDRTIFFSFAQPTEGGARTAVARAVLDLQGLRLNEVKVIFAQKDEPSGGHHWGSRLVFDRHGMLFVTLGDRFSGRDKAQDLSSHLGKIVRIAPDGSVPPDNPFVAKPGALPEIWSYGHRNVQGAALHPVTGNLWAHEHGPQGGDEVNEVLPGRNYGWPVITYGREYVIGTKIGEGTERADVQPPKLQWTPSIAPSGMAFSTSSVYPGWQGDLFVGALKFRLVSRLSEQGDKLVERERLLQDAGKRIRDVRQGPDGKLWVLDETDGAVLRLDPI
ncbi:PQQ-dependent sugar dehydrogenase [Azoarcus communis]|uniref:PQQ-dependent sugar dehydrogenase n=2 Tax=Parazoarcus communis TaxID=41977 RepID=A0A323V761_9RHOO|nr:PQQ-dependent sugar dehydrogenase [Parazoarcus communis SWub3 = DSM 12120]PZA15968.1 PQQ-dependent sugar dehydrogenase [Azoarcus communis] [Parazoarcus communis SWub3 = DSM 12120]